MGAVAAVLWTAASLDVQELCALDAVGRVVLSVHACGLEDEVKQGAREELLNMRGRDAECSLGRGHVGDSSEQIRNWPRVPGLPVSRS